MSSSTRWLIDRPAQLVTTVRTTHERFRPVMTCIECPKRKKKSFSHLNYERDWVGWRGFTHRLLVVVFRLSTAQHGRMCVSVIPFFLWRREIRYCSVTLCLKRAWTKFAMIFQRRVRSSRHKFIFARMRRLTPKPDTRSRLFFSC